MCDVALNTVTELAAFQWEEIKQHTHTCCLAVSGAGSQKIKTAHKLKAQTSKIVSSFKGPTVSCSLVREYSGHKDGIWEVTAGRVGQPVIGTAAAGGFRGSELSQLQLQKEILWKFTDKKN